MFDSKQTTSLCRQRRQQRELVSVLNRGSFLFYQYAVWSHDLFQGAQFSYRVDLIELRTLPFWSLLTLKKYKQLNWIVKLHVLLVFKFHFSHNSEKSVRSPGTWTSTKALLSKQLCDPHDVTSQSYNVMPQSDSVLCQTATATCIIALWKRQPQITSASGIHFEIRCNGHGAFR